MITQSGNELQGRRTNLIAVKSLLSAILQLVAGVVLRQAMLEEKNEIGHWPRIEAYFAAELGLAMWTFAYDAKGSRAALSVGGELASLSSGHRCEGEEVGGEIRAGLRVPL